MASFVESATLMVKDQSTAEINKINAALKKLFSTAKSLKSVKVDFKINERGMIRAAAGANRLLSDLRQLKSAGKVNIKVDASGLASARRQLNQIRTAARQPIAVNTRGGTTARAATGAAAQRGGGHGLMARTAMGGIRAGVHILGGIVGLEAGSISAIGAAVGRATREGYMQTDRADSNLALRQMGPEKEGQIRDAVKRIQEAPGGQYWNRAQTQQLMAESTASTGGDVGSGEFLVKQAASLAKVGQNMGQSAEQARTGALDFIKAGEQVGAFSDSQTDKFDQAKAAKYFDTMRQATMQVGEEFTGQKWRTTVGSAGVSKFGIDNRGMMTLALQMEEQGTKAGVGLNEAIKNLSTTRLDKKKVANLERLGLVSTEQVKTGEIGGKSVTEIFGKGAVNETELRKNILGWVMSDKFKGAMKQSGVTDPNDPTQVQKFAGKITSGKGTDFLTGLIIRAQEIERDIKLSESRKADIETTDRITDKSGVVAGTSFKNQMQSVLGETANALEPVLLPIAKSATKFMQESAGTIRAASEGDPASIAKVGVAATAGTAAATAAGLALAPAISAIGKGVAVAGMTDDKTGLSHAGFALNSAADALRGSATALTGAAVAQQGKGLIGLAAGAAGTVAVTLAAAAAALVASTRPAGGASNIPELEKLKELQQTEVKAKLEKKAKEEERAKLQENLPNIPAEYRPVAEQEIARLGTVIDSLNNTIKVTESEMRRLNETEQAKSKRVGDAFGDLKDASEYKPPAWLADTARGADTKPVPVQFSKKKTKPIKSIWEDSEDARANNQMEAAKAAGEAARKQTVPRSERKSSIWGDPTQMTPASDITAAAGELTTASTSMGSVLTTGATAVGAAGQTAASFLTGAAPGIGASIGQSAAAAIQSAVSSLSINVNANVVGGGADTGSQKAAKA